VALRHQLLGHTVLVRFCTEAFNQMCPDRDASVDVCDRVRRMLYVRRTVATNPRAGSRLIGMCCRRRRAMPNSPLHAPGRIASMRSGEQASTVRLIQ
jgi:hypothetical protein